MTKTLDQSVKSLEKKLNKISKLDTDRAFSSAANKLATRAKSQVAKAVAREVRVTQKNVRSKIFIGRSTAKTGRAKITFYTRPVNAVRTNYSITKRGYKVAGKIYPRTFFARGKGATSQIFQRKGSARYPIEPVKIPIQAAVNRYAVPITADLMKRDFKKILQQEFRARINGYI